ncbi:ABC transporter [miscellaneous Crenarchaeota group archaeon SMTZ-80]|nr:MAG: ABC transporter [miscellaneous Crenarchaeota group archaeon SMTZ-80]
MKSLFVLRNQRRFVYLIDLLRELVFRDMKLKYKDSVLGMAWSFINPLLYVFIFYVIFQLVLSFDISHYPVFVLIGILTYNWFQLSLIQASGVIKDSRELIRHPGFPVAILPMTSVVSNLINYLIAVPIIVVIVLISGIRLMPSIAFLPVLMGIQFFFILGLAYLVAVVNVFFRDTQHILTVLLWLYFFLTPIFYDLSLVPKQYKFLYLLSPLAHLVDAYRAVFIKGILPDLVPLIIILMSSVLILGFSFRLYSRASSRFVEEV